MDKHYINKHEMSMIDNLKYIQTWDIKQFLENDQEKWKCSSCGGVICVHNKKVIYAIKSDKKTGKPCTRKL